jgi:Tfp pilus assembly protein PilE
MIVIAIIGILAAIAIPQFSAYRTRAFNAAAESDLRNAATAQEAYFVDFQNYADAIADLAGATFGFMSSTGVTVAVSSSSVDGYTMTSFHASGDRTWTLTGPGGIIN